MSIFNKTVQHLVKLLKEAPAAPVKEPSTKPTPAPSKPPGPSRGPRPGAPRPGLKPAPKAGAALDYGDNVYLSAALRKRGK